MPPAPPSFSMITRWPKISPSRAARIRPMMSPAPPAANGITMVTGRSGQFCAAAGALAAASIAKPASVRIGAHDFAGDLSCDLTGNVLGDFMRDFLGPPRASTVAYKDRRIRPRPQAVLAAAPRYAPGSRLDSPGYPHDLMTQRAMMRPKSGAGTALQACS